MKLHHIGIATTSIERTRSFYLEQLNYQIESDVIEDPIQQVRVQFIVGHDHHRIELIEPMGEQSPIQSVLKRQHSSFYHVCYIVEDLDFSIQQLRDQGNIVAKKAEPAVAFEHKRVAFIYTKEHLLIELVEMKSIS